MLATTEFKLRQPGWGTHQSASVIEWVQADKVGVLLDRSCVPLATEVQVQAIHPFLADHPTFEASDKVLESAGKCPC